MSVCIERKVPVYKLLRHKNTLRQLLSFSANIDRCNFTCRTGWGGKTYVNDDGHGVDEYKPSIRGIDLLDIHYLKLTDMVILTDDQYSDYKTVAESD